MASDQDSAAASALDPVSRVAEVLFGLIMVLTFTGTLSVTTAGREDIREMLAGAIGCNLAWGVIDALLFLLGCYTLRSRNTFLLKKLQGIADPAAGRELIAGELPEVMGEIFEESHIEHLRQGLLKVDPSKFGRLLKAPDYWAAFLVFALVFLAVFPVAIPFLLMQDPKTALRISNIIAIALMVGCGYTLAHYTGGKSWGMATALIGISVVFLTIHLGG